MKFEIQLLLKTAIIITGIFTSLPAFANASFEPFWAVTVEDARASARVNIGSKTGHDVGVKTRQSRMI